MDETDAKIIAILRERGNESNTEIAKRVGLSEAAVRKRIANLVEGSVIRKFTIELGSRAAISALVLVAVEAHQPVDRIAAKVEKMKGVVALYEITGNYDIAVVIEGADSGALNSIVDEVRNLQHVAGTDTRMGLRKWK